MMYLSYTNDYHKDDEQLLLAVVLDDEFYRNVKIIKDIHQHAVFPYLVKYTFTFPTEKVRLLEAGFLDEVITDMKEYASWELGGDDPLDYYRYQIHPYEPKEDFWHSRKPDAVMLTHSGGNYFGFNASIESKMYYGYEIDWSGYVENKS